MRITTVILDSADPAKLAEFYRSALGWEPSYSDDTYVFLGTKDAARLGFQKVEGYRGPSWPEERVHAHVDFEVTDVAEAVATFVSLGATKPDHQPGGDDWTVLLDPEGHPFCVMPG